jgi:excisionase family DNA binding protein
MSYSTREAAKKLGLHLITIQKYIAAGKIPVPPMSMSIGGGKVRIWTDQDVEKVKEVLPKIANGRKTRYKKQSAVSKQSVKTKAQARVPGPHKTRKPKKKK